MVKYINKAIQSVLNRIFKIFELIIIDDGSKDNSKKKLLIDIMRIRKLLQFFKK